MKKIAKPVLSKRYFHEEIEKEQKILDIGLKMSRTNEIEKKKNRIRKTTTGIRTNR